jgi:hypothetical protein
VPPSARHVLRFTLKDDDGAIYSADVSTDAESSDGRVVDTWRALSLRRTRPHATGQCRSVWGLGLTEPRCCVVLQGQLAAAGGLAFGDKAIPPQAALFH